MPHEHTHLAGEARRSHIIQIGLSIFFILVWILDSFVFRLTSYLWLLPLYIVMIIGFSNLTYILSFLLSIIPGLFIIIAGIYLMSRSHIVFEPTEPKVVDYGLYARIRHPMYLGSILLYLGFWITTLSLLTLIPLLTVIIGYNYLATGEEHLLEAKFGNDYLDYKKRVPKWIPR
ncbi:MAG: methyltransferase family protein [Promethearchaeota archaeon]